jgi:autotransporter family porin
LVARSHLRSRIPSARTARRAKRLHPAKPKHQNLLPWLRCVDRRSLLAGTALASTLLLGIMLAPTSASALTCAGDVGTGPAPIDHGAVNDFIICVNTEPRTNAAGIAIYLSTINANHFIDLYTSGTLSSTNAGTAVGIFTVTSGDNSPLSIENVGAITATSTGLNALGIFALTSSDGSPLDLVNSGDIAATATTGDAFGISVRTDGSDNPLAIVNGGDIAANAADDAYGIFARTTDVNSPIAIENSGNLAATAVEDAFGIFADTFGAGSPTSIVNSGHIWVTGGDADGINANANGASSPLSIVNNGDITATANVEDAYGIIARTTGNGSPVSVENNGNIEVNAPDDADGIKAITFAPYSPVSIVNSGDITATGAIPVGIYVRTINEGSPVSIVNSGDLKVTSTLFDANGIFVQTFDVGNSVSIENSGDITSTTSGFDAEAKGIFVQTTESDSPISIVNSGDLTSTATGPYGDAYGIEARANATGNSIFVDNSGDMNVRAPGDATGIFVVTESAAGGNGVSIKNSGDMTVISDTYLARGISVFGGGPNSPVTVENSGDITAIVGASPFTDRSTGIQAASGGANSPLMILNSGRVVALGVPSYGIYAGSYTSTAIANRGYITAESLFAIETFTASTTIRNYGGGVIMGFVDLTDSPDQFLNQSGGTFAARLTSDFGSGTDLFRNEQDGTVHAVAVGASQPSFVNLERFENKGLISLVDGEEGDIFQISNTVGGTDLAFAASGDSTLAVDAFLGPPGSTADNFIIDGNVTGKTALTLNNTNPGPGVFNPDGIPVVFVPNGQVQSNAFFLPQPFDSGLFDWDLYFVPTGSGFFELRSFPGGGAHVLPQLLTAGRTCSTPPTRPGSTAPPICACC